MTEAPLWAVLDAAGVPYREPLGVCGAGAERVRKGHCAARVPGVRPHQVKLAGAGHGEGALAEEGRRLAGALGLMLSETSHPDD